MSSPKDGDNMGKVGKGAPEPQQPRAVGPYRGLVIRNDDFSIGLGLDFTEPLNPWFLQKIEPKTHPTNASEPRAPVSSEACKENSLITPSPELAPKPLAFAPAVNGATCSNGVPNVEDAAPNGVPNGSNDIDLDLKL
ncbi:hypothetical protein DCAR_0103371 [Daucus carota subsp. sativus]|uniref:Uncharacterized protein n=1 Tax=Daucus carota subsp. sativus TaxID=79200 RepID=A0A166HY72_DAUCS|nr:hypothetical protein DCAR_0103371 [Daucus carota subsp. sativus]